VKISVVTVCYNAAGTLEHTLRSFFAQDHADKELLVIDGGSKDGTADLVARYAAPELVFLSERDNGLYDAMNKGLRRFSGEAVGFLNADDRFAHSGVLSAIDRALTEADVTSGDLDFVGDHEASQVVRRWRTTPCPEGGFRSGWMPAHPTFYARRKVIEGVGEFDTTMKIAADYDFMLRAVELQKARVGLVDGLMVHMMAGGASNGSIGNYVRSNLEALGARRKWLGSGLIDRALLAKPLGKLSQFFR
jgi:glycosyltransferase involved in cell wall biosynthesis